jgi:hypothetical protein
MSVAAIALAALSASATVLEELSLDEMTQRADAIVHGVVVRSGTRTVMADDGSAQLQTITQVRVLRWLKGNEGTTVTIRERGGESQDRGMWISGTPRYAANEEVVVFLERWADRPDFRTFGMVQGKFQVRHGLGPVPASVSRDLEGVGLARWADDGAMSVVPGQSEPAMELETFVRHVLRVVEAAR